MASAFSSLFLFSDSYDGRLCFALFFFSPQVHPKGCVPLPLFLGIPTVRFPFFFLPDATLRSDVKFDSFFSFPLYQTLSITVACSSLPPSLFSLPLFLYNVAGLNHDSAVPFLFWQIERRA